MAPRCAFRFLKLDVFPLCLVLPLVLTACNGQLLLEPPPKTLVAPTVAASAEGSAQVLLPLLGNHSLPADAATSPLATAAPPPIMIHLQEGVSNTSLPIFPNLSDADPDTIQKGTAGASLMLGGIAIHLPDDAYVESITWPDESAPAVPERPYVILRRGQLRVAVTVETGRIFVDSPTYEIRQEAIAAFDFLIQLLGPERILPPDASCVDCPQLFESLGSLPTFRGMNLYIAEKSIQMPEEVYHVPDPWHRPVDIAPEVTQLAPPVDILGRGVYSVAVSITSGELYFPATDAETRSQAMQAFDFLVQALGTETVLPPNEACTGCARIASPLPTPTQTPGRFLLIADQWVQVPADVKNAGIVTYPDMQPAELRLQEFPVLVLVRGSYFATISLRSGEMVFNSTSEGDQPVAILAFDFLIEALGEERIIPRK